MNSDESIRYILKKLDNIEGRLVNIEKEIIELKTNWAWVKKVFTAIITFITTLTLVLDFIRRNI